MQMKENLSVFESILRIAGGIGLIIFAFIGDRWLLANYALIGIAIVGTILLLTGIQRACPLYHVLGLSTR